MNLKKLLCLLLALVMVLSLVACDSSDDRRDRDDDDDDDEEISEDKDKNKDDEDDADEDKDDMDYEDNEDEEPVAADLSEELLGSWTVEISITEEMTGMEGLEITDIPFVFTFQEDNTVVLSVDPEAGAIVAEQMLDLMEEMVYTEMEAEGLTRDDVDALFQEAYGMSLSEYMVDAIDEMGMDSMLEEIEETCDYEVDGDTLTIDGVEMTFEISGNELIITDCEGDFWTEVGLELPVTMKRAK